VGLGVEGRRGGDGVVSREEASVDIDLGVVEEFRRVADAVASEALGGEPIMLHLCDNRLHTIRSERLGKR